MAKSEEKPPVKAEKPPEAEASTFHVVGPGKVKHRDKVLAPGAILKLTAEEAASLGDSVAPGRPKPPPTPAELRADGIFKCVAAVKHNGKLYAVGDLIELSAKDAKSLGDAITDPE